MQTVISVFEDHRAAQRAVDRLLEEGFKPDDVHLQEGTAQANTAIASIRGAAAGAQTGSERGVLSSFGHFFASLFDQDPPSGYPDRYSEAVRRGHPVVVVDATDPEQVQRAVSVVHEVGAFDIDERAAQWQDEGMKAGTSSSTGVVMGTGPGMQSQHADRSPARVFQRHSGQPLRELFLRHQEQPAGDHPDPTRRSDT